jgi:hypothetical protein
MTTLTVDVGGAGKAVLTATPAAGDEAGLLAPASPDDAGRLRHFLASVATWHAEAQQERDGGWVLHIPGTGLVGSGQTFDAAIGDLIGELRQYADDWAELRSAPNHRDNLGLVLLVILSTDAELRDWLLSPVVAGADRPGRC